MDEKIEERIEEVVRIENVGKVFKQEKKEFYALKNISFNIEKGEIFGLLGPNGAGKTTLINILLGMLKPNGGRASIFGYDVTNQREKLSHVVNSSSGETEFHWLLRGREILDYFGRFYGLSKEQREMRIQNLVDAFELQNVLKMKFGWMSTGQKMRVILCKALINNPKFIMLDEPTLGLDPDIAKKTRELVAEINKKFGTTILLTSHYMQEVEQLCGRIAFIDHGEIIDIGKIEKLKKSRFKDFKLEIRLKEIRSAELLKKMGFEISPSIRTIEKSITDEEQITQILNELVKNGFDIINVEVHHPTLEDYFLKMVEENHKNNHELQGQQGQQRGGKK
ncbi:MAG TPA: ABC transporter ATP-binding protein [archaeon]|nr:ABC transporter ATP-binding protein [archaeon]